MSVLDGGETEEGGEWAVEPAALAVSVRPGLPAAMELLPGYPFEETFVSPSGGPAFGLFVLPGARLPSFNVMLKDR